MSRNDVSVSLIVAIVGAGFLIIGGFMFSNSINNPNSSNLVTGVVMMLVGAGIVSIAKKLE